MGERERTDGGSEWGYPVKLDRGKIYTTLLALDS